MKNGPEVRRGRPRTCRKMAAAEEMGDESRLISITGTPEAIALSGRPAAG
jgi:hypothetical protein